MRLFGLWLLCCMFYVGTVTANPPQYAYRISFTDKGGSVAPQLSARSLLRRNHQNLTLDSTDRPVVARYIDSVINLTQGELHNTSRWLNQCVVLVTDSSRIQHLTHLPFVKNIAWVGYFATGLHRSIEPTSARAEIPYNAKPYSVARTTGTAAYYGNTYGQTTLVHGDYLHDRGYKGKGLLIAVLDAGFSGVDTDPGFDSLRVRNGIIDTYNFLYDNNAVYNNIDHGSDCLSLMGGNLPGTYVGAAPDASYALYATEDYACSDELYELDNMIAGMERADSLGVDIISSSLGYNEFPCAPMPYFIYQKSDLDGKTTTVAQAINYAVQKGIFASITAGNEGGDSWNYLLTPGDADSCMTIGSVDNTKSPSSFSSPGPNAAGRIKPDVCLQGQAAAVMSGNNAVSFDDGTSFSTPQLAGWAACLWQFNPNVTPYQLRTAITKSADHYTNPGAQIGYGVPDFSKAAGFLAVNPVNPVNSQLQVMPNPFLDFINVRFSFAQPGLVDFTVIDAVGRTIALRQIQANGGMQTIQIDLPASLSAGIYLLKASNGSQLFTHKLVHP